MTKASSTIAPATKTTFQVGSYNSVSDVFTSALDLNDRASYWLVSVDMPQPQKVYSRSNSIRVAGERIANWNYANRHIKIVVQLLYAANTPALLTSVQALQAAIENPPYRLAFAAPLSTILTYADVVAVSHNIPYDPKLILSGAINKITLDFECLPGLAGDRVTLMNLALNPGFEAPSGPGVSAFSDTFANLNAYDPQQYSATVLADSPLRYYQMDEVSGTSAIDSGSQKQNGTYTGGFTLAQQPAPAGGADYAVLLNGSTGYLSLPTTSLPTGAITVEAWIYISAAPGATARVCHLGNTTNGQFLVLAVLTTQKLQITNGTVTVTGATTITTGAWHHVVGYYDGVNIGIYLDGAAQGVPTAASLTLTYGAANFGANSAGSGSFFPGQLDECAIYSGALSSGRVTAHYNAGAPAALTQAPANTYVDIVMANGGANLLRYHRLSEASGSVAYDISGVAAQGTYVGSPTLGVSGAISGDSDTAITLNGTSQYVSMGTAGLPTGSGAFSFGCWVKIASNPATTARAVMFLGDNVNTNGAAIAITTSGTVQGFLWGGTNITSAALSLNVWHHVMLTYAGGAGGTLTLYVDGASVGTTAITGALTYAGGGAYIGYGNGSASLTWLPGSVDEACVWSAALSGAQITAIYNAGHSGATGTVASAMALGSGAQCSFGSPAWGAINTWATRFRWVSGLSTTWYLHYTDASNSLYCNLNASGTLALKQQIAGVTTTLGTASFTLTHEAWYWLNLTQFPAGPGNPPAVMALIYYDRNGAQGNSLAGGANVVEAGAADGLTALIGAPRMANSGAALVVGGVSGGVAVSLFGPGGWTFNANSGGTATGLASGAWEQNTANTYPSGPVVSYGAGRIDLPMAGTVDSDWRLYTGGSPTGALAAMPVKASGDVLALSAYVKSSGLSASASISLQSKEYDASGALLLTSTLATATGNQAAWRQLSFALTTGSGGTTAYVALILRITDTAVAGESAGGTVWFDNAQCYDQTALGVTSMPYCELRFPQSPATLMVSGLLGEMASPALVAFGTFLASFATSTALNWAMGARSHASSKTILAGSSVPFTPVNTGSLALSVTPQLDATAYSGYDLLLNLTSAGVNPLAFSFAPGDLLGSYHILTRAWTFESGGNLANVQTRVASVQRSLAWWGLSDTTDILGVYYGAYQTPFAAGGWAICDAGQVNVPALPVGANTDLTQNYLTPRAQWVDNTGGGGLFISDWQILLPIDAGVMKGLTNNPSNAFNVTNKWIWHYSDGMYTAQSSAAPNPVLTYSTETTPLANAAHGGGGPGTQTTGSINPNLLADPFLAVDPTVVSSGVSGVNQFAAYISDTAVDVLPWFCDISYTPRYLYPRAS